MDDRFIPLATFLRGAPGMAMPAAPASSSASAATPAPQAGESSVARGIIDFAHADLVHELALMRLAALEGFERAAHRLLRRLASDVLGRELLLAPIELDALVATAIASLSDAEPVALAISAADADRVRSPLPLRIDPALVVGDLVVDVRDGAIESHFAFRLQSALDRAERAA